jgi:hypothetical protein
MKYSGVILYYIMRVKLFWLDNALHVPCVQYYYNIMYILCRVLIV